MAEQIEGEPEILEEQAENETPENEEATEEPKTPEAEKPENQEELLKERDTLRAQKDHWRTKYQKLEKETEDLRKKKELASETQADDEFRPRVEFLLQNRDIDGEEYDHLAAVALRDSGKITLESLREARKSESGYLSFLRKSRENKSKTPGSTSPSAVSKFQKSAEEIAKMTPEEHRKYEEQMSKESQGI